MTVEPASAVRVFAPGRVNLIGEHTDYTGGLVFPMAIQHGITIEASPRAGMIDLQSDQDPTPLLVPLPCESPASVNPLWGRYVAGVANQMQVVDGIAGRVTSDLPVAGLSSSAALEVAVALALGFTGDAVTLAKLCQRAEHIGSGVPSGIMDQLAAAGGVADKALLIDCHSLEVTPTALPPGADFVVVHSGQARTLVNSAYALRRHQCEAAEVDIGPLRLATPDQLVDVASPIIRSRARHVISENQRVRDFVTALAQDDIAGAGELMNDSHRSLATDFDVSTPVLDQLVARLRTIPGVHGARLTGAGFGGAVVALAEPGALSEGFVARPSAGALQQRYEKTCD